MTNFVGPVYELFCRKPKICNGFCKTNFEPEPNNQLSDSYHKLVIRHPQVVCFNELVEQRLLGSVSIIVGTTNGILAM